MFNNKRKRVELASIVLRSPNAQMPSESPEPVFPKKEEFFQVFLALLLVIFLGIVAAYFLYSGNETEGGVLANAEVIKRGNTPSLPQQNESIASRDSLLAEIKQSETSEQDPGSTDANYPAYTNSVSETGEPAKTNNIPGVSSDPSTTSAPGISKTTEQEANEPATVKTQYNVPAKAYFYSQPNDKFRKNNFISSWKRSYAPLNALDEKNGFIYVVFSDNKGQTSEGWLRKKDVKQVKSIVYQGDLK